MFVACWYCMPLFSLDGLLNAIIMLSSSLGADERTCLGADRPPVSRKVAIRGGVLCWEQNCRDRRPLLSKYQLSENRFRRTEIFVFFVLFILTICVRIKVAPPTYISQCLVEFWCHLYGIIPL